MIYNLLDTEYSRSNLRQTKKRSDSENVDFANRSKAESLCNSMPKSHILGRLKLFALYKHYELWTCKLSHEGVFQ